MSRKEIKANELSVYVEKELAATQLSTMMIKPLFARFLPLCIQFGRSAFHFSFFVIIEYALFLFEILPHLMILVFDCVFLLFLFGLDTFADALFQQIYCEFRSEIKK